MNLMKLLLIFLKLGAFTIGGGYAMVPLIQQEMVSRGLLTQTEALDMLAISQMTPGPLAINAATFSGMRTRGIPGAVVATFGVVLPSLIIAILVGKFFFQFKESRTVRSALSGMRPVVLSLILASALSVMGETFLRDSGALDVPAICVGIVSAILVMAVKKVPPVAVIVVSGLFGAVFLR